MLTFCRDHSFGALLLLLIIVIFISAFSGRMDIPYDRILDAIIHFPSLIVSVFDGDYSQIASDQRMLMLIRFPRILLAILVGCGLSVSGAVYQGLFRNPLVSPDILGVAAGCTFGAAVGLIIPETSFTFVRFCSFAMGLTAVLIALMVAKAVSSTKVLVLVLTGIITGSMFHAFFMIIKTIADPYNQLPAIVFWVMGSMASGSWEDVYQIVPVIVGGYVVFHLMRNRLNILSLGDEQAKSLGVNPSLLRMVLIVISSLVVSACVASCGQVAWVGLVIPHIVRSIVGPNHRKVIPCCALLGGAFLLGADTIARTAFSNELPLGIITSLIGAPLFAWQIYKTKGTGWS